MKTQKGKPGYIKAKKTKNLIYALGEFAVIIIILITGYVTTGTNKNIFTIIAILGCLPAAKMLVGYIVMIPYKSISDSTAKEITQKTPYLTSVFDLIITDKDKIMPVEAIVISDTTICGYAPNEKTDTERVSKHIKTILKSNDVDAGTVKVFREFKPFITRAEGLNSMRAVDKNDTAAIENKIKELTEAISM